MRRDTWSRPASWSTCRWCWPSAASQAAAGVRVSLVHILFGGRRLFAVRGRKLAIRKSDVLFMKSSNAISIGSSLSAVSGIFDNQQLFWVSFQQGFDYFPCLIQTGVRNSFSPMIRNRGFSNSGAIRYGHQFVGKSSGTSIIAGLALYCMTKGIEIVEIRRKELPMKAFTRLFGVCRNHGQIAPVDQPPMATSPVQNFLLFEVFRNDSPVIFQHFRITQVVAIQWQRVNLSNPRWSKASTFNPREVQFFASVGSRAYCLHASFVWR